MKEKLEVAYYQDAETYKTIDATPKEVLMILIKYDGSCRYPYIVYCSTCPIGEQIGRCMSGTEDDSYPKLRKALALKQYEEEGYCKEDLVGYLI